MILHERNSEAVLSGLRVLAMLAPGNTEETRYVVAPLEAAKMRWGWTVSILCEAKDKIVYSELAAPLGQLFSQPSISSLKLPAAWETDPATVADVDRRLKEAELLTGLPAARIILAAAQTIGRAFVSPVIRLIDTSITRTVLSDNSEASRIVRRLFKFADEVLERSSPDFVFTYEWAKPWRHAVWLAAARRGIPCIVVRRSKIRSDQCFLTNDPLMLNTAAFERATERRRTNAPISREATSYICSFRDQPRMVKYVQTKWHLMGRQSWLMWHARFLRGLPRQLRKLIKRGGKSTDQSILKRLLDYNRRYVVTPGQRRWFHQMSEETLAQTRFIYFAMHKETDLPLTLQAAAWSDQRNTVGLLAGLLPHGYCLLVREHRLNFGLRPLFYYRDLARLPSVTLIDPFDSQFKYLRNADLIVTENGSSGWEGLILRKPVLTLARTFYDGSGLAHQVTDPNKLGSTILELLAGRGEIDLTEYDRNLGCMIDAEIETTLPMDFRATPDLLRRLGNMLVPLVFRSAPPLAIHSTPASTQRVDSTAQGVR